MENRMISLNSRRLRVEIAPPGVDVNRTSRFDRSGFITDVVLDGTIRFAASEPRNLWHPCTGGRGFCNEFKVDLSDQCDVGAFFPKFGVGLFPKQASPHQFYSQYPQMIPFPVTVTAGEDWAEFVTDAIPCCGFAMKTTKRISVSENELYMEIRAENLGERTINTLEYCHNFISICGMGLGPAYRLELPQMRSFEQRQLQDIHGLPCNWSGTGNSLSLMEYRPDVSHVRVDIDSLSEDYLDWRLVHRGARAAVSCREHYRPAGMEVWAAEHMVSPEVFYRLELAPGESRMWCRTWRFEEL